MTKNKSSLINLIGIIAYIFPSICYSLNLNAGTNSAFNVNDFAAARPDFAKKGWWIKGYWYDYKPSAYEEEIIVTAAKMANAAYTTSGPISLLDSERFAVGVGSLGFTGIYITSQSKKIGIVSFRGSTTGKDWMDDFDARWEDDQYYGFLKRIKESFPVWSKQLEDLKKKHSDLNDILFTGHSLGAAESNIAAVYLGERRHTIPNLKNIDIHVVNFASPRPGGKIFQARFERNIVFHRRIVNAGDPVTNLPLWAMGYTHMDNGIMFYPSANGMNMVKFDSKKDPNYGGLSKVNYLGKPS